MDETAEPKLAKDGNVAKLLRAEAKLPLSGGMEDMKEPLDMKDSFLLFPRRHLSSGIEDKDSKLERSFVVQDNIAAKAGMAVGWSSALAPASSGAAGPTRGSIVPKMPYVCPSWFASTSAGYSVVLLGSSRLSTG
jgi:hypothetical protein